jgi:hypothetical protein
MLVGCSLRFAWVDQILEASVSRLFAISHSCECDVFDLKEALYAVLGAFPAQT